MTGILLTDKIVANANQYSQKIVFHWLNDDAEVVSSLSFTNLLQKSKILATNLLKLGILPGDRVLLVYPPSVDFLISFIACLLGGIIAVPTSPPDPNKLRKDLTMFSTITTSCGAKIALTSSSYHYMTKLATMKEAVTSFGLIHWPELKWITTDIILQSLSESTSSSSTIQLPTITPESVAFLQYTSGSTSEPKGVMITHGNLAHNLTIISSGILLDNTTVVVSWLPHYHDMGLIGSICGPLYCGGTGYYFSPLSFIRNPSLWIRIISTYRGTHMQAPNFAYALTARKFLSFVSNQSISGVSNMSKYGWLETIDLSCVRHMINAAEPVDAATIDLFHGVFSKYGLPLGVIYPTYGLAEHTVYVCSNGRSRLIVDKTQLEKEQIVSVLSSSSQTSVTTVTKEISRKVMIGCGKPSASEGLDLKIVSLENGTILPDGKIGEIWLKSKSCAIGYWALPDKSKEDFDAILCSDISDSDMISADGGYLKTGDLGFMYEEELFICGRLKDLIIIRGHNHYPQDIEKLCESRFSKELRGGCSAAFSSMINGEEALVYAAEATEEIFKEESSHQYQFLLQSIQLTIMQEHGVTPYAIVLLQPKTIFKTTSGKIARQWVRKGYETSMLKSVATWTVDNITKDSETIETIHGQIDEMNIATNAPENPIDPTDMSIHELIPYVKLIVMKALESISDNSNRKHNKVIKANVPLSAFGLDSVTGVQLHSYLESWFTVKLPEGLMNEPDATITTIATILSQGGNMRDRPVLYNCWEVLSEAARRERLSKGKGKGILSSDWLRSHGLRANVDSLQFIDGCARIHAPLSIWGEMRYIIEYIVFLILFLGPPVTMVAIFFVLSFSTAMTILITALTVVYTYPADSWPPAFRTSGYYINVMKYFSYRVLVESKIDTSIPSIYAFGPHGVFALPPVFQTIVNEFIIGQNFHLLGADAVFQMPIYNIMAKLCAMKPISKKSFVSILKKGRSVGLIPGGIAEMFGAGDNDQEVLVVADRKGFIKIALETGAQIIPTFTYGHSQTLKTKRNVWLEKASRALRLSLTPFWGRWGIPIPFRGPLVTVIGTPILCPKVENPSQELIDQYHETYLKETRRIYDTYKNIYNWHKPDRPLIFKK